MRIGDCEIGGNNPPYIVAEISGNHCGDLDKALHLIEMAKWAGADAVKTQCYEPQTITLDCDAPDFVIKDGPWKGRKLFELYGKAQTPFAWHPTLYAKARDTKIEIFSSVFDYSSIDLLESLDCPAYKIASMELTDTPLIRYAVKTNKPLIISTGMAENEEIYSAYREAANCAFLFCVSGYPTPVEEANVYRMKAMNNWLPEYRPIGISDHTLGWEVPIVATALGADIIEKHLCLSREDNTEDADFSLEPGEFKAMVEAVHRAYQCMEPSVPKSEESSRQLRRSLYVVKDVQKGEVFTPENIRSIRPGYGLPPSHLDKVIGRRAGCDIKRGTALSESLIHGG